MQPRARRRHSNQSAARSKQFTNITGKNLFNGLSQEVDRLNGFVVGKLQISVWHDVELRVIDPGQQNIESIGNGIDVRRAKDDGQFSTRASHHVLF